MAFVAGQLLQTRDVGLSSLQGELDPLFGVPSAKGTMGWDFVTSGPAYRYGARLTVQQSLRQDYEESDPAEDVSHILTGLRDGMN